MRSWSTAAVALAASLGAASARAQAFVHPLPSGPAPLHERAARADRAVLATVDAVEPGRIRLREGHAVLGDVEARFAVKRSPSRTPALEPGQRVLLLLRGARAPYVLVEGARGVFVLSDADAEERWEAAVREIAAAGSPERLVPVYSAWLDSPDAGLRDEARLALLEGRAPLAPLSPEAAVLQARHALDTGRPAETRAVSAQLATSRREGLDALVAGLRDAEGAAEAGVLRAVLTGAARASHPALAELLLRALEHPDRLLRRQALRLAPSVWSEPVAGAVAHVAAQDADARARREASRLLEERGAPP